MEIITGVVAAVVGFLAGGLFAGACFGVRLRRWEEFLIRRIESLEQKLAQAEQRQQADDPWRSD